MLAKNTGIKYYLYKKYIKKLKNTVIAQSSYQYPDIIITFGVSNTNERKT